MFELKDLPEPRHAGKAGSRVPKPRCRRVADFGSSGLLPPVQCCLLLKPTLTVLPGLSQTQFFVLILLKRNPDGLSIDVLADGVSVTSQTINSIIDRMEAAGLCEREQHPQDRRAWVVRLTEYGAQVLGKALPAHYVWVAKLMSHFDESERDTLVKLMFKLKQEGVLPKANGG